MPFFFFLSFIILLFFDCLFVSITGIVTLKGSLSILKGVSLMSESYLPDIQSLEKKHF